MGPKAFLRWWEPLAMAAIWLALDYTLPGGGNRWTGITFFACSLSTLAVIRALLSNCEDTP